MALFNFAKMWWFFKKVKCRWTSKQRSSVISPFYKMLNFKNGYFTMILFLCTNYYLLRSYYVFNIFSLDTNIICDDKLKWILKSKLRPKILGRCSNPRGLNEWDRKTVEEFLKSLKQWKYSGSFHLILLQIHHFLYFHYT